MKKPQALLEARQTAKGILSPEVWQFIDVKKFARSLVCELAMEASIEHMKKHHDCTQAKPWLRAFADTEFFEAVVNYFTENAGLIFSVNSGIVEFSRSTVPSSEYRHFLDFHARSSAKTLEGLYGRGFKLKADSVRGPYLDAMDSRKRLPGSFESGRN